ncbi:MAG: DUF4248 domain-containing protein [Bacteroides sp.]|nr:DUF4248 domain-containing protein [Bacteroides sp.]
MDPENKELNKQLTDMGVTPRTRIFTPRQVKIIVEALGEP